MLNMILLFIGTTEIIVIGAIALLFFGGRKLPELMRGLGKGVKEFKEGMHEVKDEITGDKVDVNASETLSDEEKEPQEQAALSKNE